MPPGRSLQMDRRTALYRLYDINDQLLYIGIAFDPATRGYQHKKTKSWWPEVAWRDVTWFETRREAEAAEREALRAERPLYNVAGSSGIPAATSPTVRATPAVVETLRRATSAYKSARTRLKNSETELQEAILTAAADGLTAAQIAKAIEWQYSETQVSQLIHGEA